MTPSYDGVMTNTQRRAVAREVGKGALFMSLGLLAVAVASLSVPTAALGLVLAAAGLTLLKLTTANQKAPGAGWVAFDVPTSFYEQPLTKSPKSLLQVAMDKSRSGQFEDVRCIRCEHLWDHHDAYGCFRGDPGAGWSCDCKCKGGGVQ